METNYAKLNEPEFDYQGVKMRQKEFSGGLITPILAEELQDRYPEPINSNFTAYWNYNSNGSDFDRQFEMEQTLMPLDAYNEGQNSANGYAAPIYHNSSIGLPFSSSRSSSLDKSDDTTVKNMNDTMDTNLTTVQCSDLMFTPRTPNYHFAEEVSFSSSAPYYMPQGKFNNISKKPHNSNNNNNSDEEYNSVNKTKKKSAFYNRSGEKRLAKSQFPEPYGEMNNSLNEHLDQNVSTSNWFEDVDYQIQHYEKYPEVTSPAVLDEQEYYYPEAYYYSTKMVPRTGSNALKDMRHMHRTTGISNAQQYTMYYNMMTKPSHSLEPSLPREIMMLSALNTKRCRDKGYQINAFSESLMATTEDLRMDPELFNVLVQILQADINKPNDKLFFKENWAQLLSLEANRIAGHTHYFDNMSSGNQKLIEHLSFEELKILSILCFKISESASYLPTVRGVYLDRKRNLWRGNWRENGKVRTRGFTQRNNGNEARNMAIIARKLVELKTCYLHLRNSLTVPNTRKMFNQQQPG